MRSNEDLPIRPVQAWVDSKGTIYLTKQSALYAEIERVLGHVGGTGESLAPGLARTLASLRQDLVPLLNAFDTEDPSLIDAIIQRIGL